MVVSAGDIPFTKKKTVVQINQFVSRLRGQTEPSFPKWVIFLKIPNSLYLSLDVNNME